MDQKSQAIIQKFRKNHKSYPEPANKARLKEIYNKTSQR
jgi:hypothetical protein